MRKATLIRLAIVTFALSTPLAAGEADGMADPNTPTVVPPPETYQASWSSGEVRHRLVRQSRRLRPLPVEVSRVLQQSIAVSGSVEFQDAGNVIGVDLASLTALRVLDGQDEEVKLKGTQFTSASTTETRDYRQLLYEAPTQFRTVWPRPSGADAIAGPEGEPDAGKSASLGFTVQFELATDQNVPSSLSLVECEVHVLCARSYLEADVPFVASDEWHQPMPDLRIRVLQADAGFSECGFWTESRCDGGQVFCFPQSNPFEPARAPVLSLPLPISFMEARAVWSTLLTGPQTVSPLTLAYLLLDTQVLTANGTPYGWWLMQEQRNNYLDLAAHSEGIVSATLLFQGPATIHHVFAVAPYDIAIPLAIHDVALTEQ